MARLAVAAAVVVFSFCFVGAGFALLFWQPANVGIEAKEGKNGSTVLELDKVLTMELNLLQKGKASEEQMQKVLQRLEMLHSFVDESGHVSVEKLDALVEKKEELDAYEGLEPVHAGEIQNLLKQISKRDQQLDAEGHFRIDLPAEVMQTPSAEELDRWRARSGDSSQLATRGFFSAENWMALRQVLIVVATGQINHAKYSMF